MTDEEMSVGKARPLRLLLKLERHGLARQAGDRCGGRSACPEDVKRPLVGGCGHPDYGGDFRRPNPEVLRPVIRRLISHCAEDADAIFVELPRLLTCPHIDLTVAAVADLLVINKLPLAHVVEDFGRQFVERSAPCGRSH